MRLQFEITNDRMDQLDALIDKAGFPTRAQFFNAAWSLFDWAVRELEQGHIIASMDEKAGTYKEAVIPGLAALRRESDLIEVDLGHLGDHLDELKGTLETEEQKESFEELRTLLDPETQEKKFALLRVNRRLAYLKRRADGEKKEREAQALEQAKVRSAAD